MDIDFICKELSWDGAKHSDDDVSKEVQPPRKAIHKSFKQFSTSIDETHREVRQLQALIHTRPDVAFFRTDKEFLERFLKARKYRVEDAFQVMCKYFQFRHHSRDLCVGLSVNNPGVQSVLVDGTVGVLPEKDPLGRPIIVILAANWNYSKYDVRTVYQAILITLEHLIEDQEVQRTGVVAVLDWSHFPSRYATTLHPRILRVFLDGLQDAFPMRIGALHVVSAPWYVEAALGISKPFFKDKLKSRIVVHGNNLHSLHNSIPPELLPAELGGENAEYNAQTWASKLIPKNKISGITVQPSFVKKDPKSLLGNAAFSGSLDSATFLQRKQRIPEPGSVVKSLAHIGCD